MKIILLIVIVIVLSIFLLGFIIQLPDNNQKTISHVIADGETTSLGKAFAPQLLAHPGLNGVHLYELNEQLKMAKGKILSWLPGLSKSSLHAKTMAFDNKGMFVGSFSFDQRSLNINNETGPLFYEPEIARLSAENSINILTGWPSELSW
jgi:phosphatidylserine/phosphatidylglycerophosphate/cardiolipin synthase-like enzyme